jgi:hypothetical protein
VLFNDLDALIKDTIENANRREENEIQLKTLSEEVANYR